VKKHSR